VEAEAAGLVGDGTVERHVAGARERGIEIAAEGDERVADALKCREQAQDLFCFARSGEREHEIALHEHANIAVHRLGRMQEERGRTGRGEGGGDLLGDDAALAHTGDDDAAARLAAA
jgi:hypothetical protein